MFMTITINMSNTTFTVDTSLEREQYRSFLEDFLAYAQDREVPVKVLKRAGKKKENHHYSTMIEKSSVDGAYTLRSNAENEDMVLGVIAYYIASLT